MLRTISLLCYVFAAMILGYALMDMRVIMFWSAGKTIMVGILIAVPFLFGTVLSVQCSNDEMEKQGIIHKMVWGLFGLYVLVLCLVLFVGNWTSLSQSLTVKPFQYHPNFIPFKMTLLYLMSLIQNPGHAGELIAFIVRNLSAFAPMGFFLPCLFRRMRDWKPFLAFAVGILICVDFFQTVLGVGSFDVDRLILNTAGMVAVFAWVRKNSVNHTLQDLYLWEKDYA